MTETPHPSGARGLVLRRLLNIAAAAALLVALYLVSSYGSVKLGQVFALFAIWGIATVSLNLINGVTGILSLGHHGFMLIGGYVTALLILPTAARDNLAASARSSLYRRRVSACLTISPTGRSGGRSRTNCSASTADNPSS